MRTDSQIAIAVAVLICLGILALIGIVGVASWYGLKAFRKEEEYATFWTGVFMCWATWTAIGSYLGFYILKTFFTYPDILFLIGYVVVAFLVPYVPSLGMIPALVAHRPARYRISLSGLLVLCALAAVLALWVRGCEVGRTLQAIPKSIRSIQG